MMAYLERTLSGRPFAAGDRFTAADIQLASSIDFTMNMIRVLPEQGMFRQYLQRIGRRPALQRSEEIDAALAATVPALQTPFS